MKNEQDMVDMIKKAVREKKVNPNAGWLDSNGMDGLRKCFEKGFSQIYVFNQRGNQRTSGELSRKEAGNVFGLDSRTPIAITLLVKKE